MLAETTLRPARTRRHGSAEPHLRTQTVRHPEDLRLVEKVVDGDPAARRQLALRLVHRVRRAASAIMRGSSDAEDAAQHALIEILRSCHNYRGDSSIERWADRICGRSVIRYARSLRKRQSPLEPAFDIDSVPAAPCANSRLDTTSGRLRVYLEALPSTRRDALVLKHGFGHSVKEIAEMTGVSPNTVKDRLQAAKFEVLRMIQRDCQPFAL